MAGDSVCAVIITFNPAPTFPDNVLNVAKQVDYIILVDNGSSGEPARIVQKLAERSCCTLIRNAENLGIAVALNQGVKHALDGEFSWICTLDQDSQISDGFIPQMLETYEQDPHRDGIALIAPTYEDRESGVRVRVKKSSKGEVLAAMTSGSMMPATAIGKVGWFDEDLYMDAVDIEFCLRARRKGMKILQSPAVLFHSLGRTRYYRWLGLRFGVTNHSAARRYYMTRNRLRLLICYARDWAWACREGTTMLLDVVKIMLLEDHKWSKFHAMAAGTVDALKGKLGKQVDL
jgi:rhamnosyltransferase